MHQIDYRVTFGDCDPAGIAYYPNIFSWMDRCFHDWMCVFGGHSAVCAKLDLAGIGLRGAEAKFLRPILDGADLRVDIAALDWAEKGIVLRYDGYVGETLSFQGSEQRALFERNATGIKAGRTQALRALIET